MANGPEKIADPYAAALADLEAKKAEIETAIAALTRVRAMTNPAEPRVVEHKAKTVDQIIDETITEMRSADPYFGMALPEAAAKRLSIIAEPQTPREIWAELARHNYPSTSENPVHAVQWALRRRSEKIGDVVLIGYGKWALKSRYTEAELEMLKRSSGGMAGRDRDIHISKTKDAIATLKSRGVHWGRPMTITAEQWATFLRARESGATVKAASATAGFSPAVAINLAKNYAIDHWKPGDQWPPTHLKLDKEGKLPLKIRLVK